MSEIVRGGAMPHTFKLQVQDCWVDNSGEFCSVSLLLLHNRMSQATDMPINGRGCQQTVSSWEKGTTPPGYTMSHTDSKDVSPTATNSVWLDHKTASLFTCNILWMYSGKTNYTMESGCTSTLQSCDCLLCYTFVSVAAQIQQCISCLKAFSSQWEELTFT